MSPISCRREKSLPWYGRISHRDISHCSVSTSLSPAVLLSCKVQMFKRIHEIPLFFKLLPHAIIKRIYWAPMPCCRLPWFMLVTLLILSSCEVRTWFEFFKIKVKVSRYTPWRRLGERRYSSYSFTTSNTSWEWVVSVTPRPHFTPGERTPGTHCTGGWVDLRAGLDKEARGKIHSIVPSVTHIWIR
jgi:hypothetical protein